MKFNYMLSPPLSYVVLLLDMHNFYVFPQQEIPVDGPSYEFLCQTTLLHFLAKYQFGFYLCVLEGTSLIVIFSLA